MAKPSLRQLDIFAQMVASGSVSHCARDLGLTIDEIVHDLTSLEMRLGYRLFENLPDRASLTPAGRKTAEAMTLLSQEQPEDWKVETGKDSPPVATPPARQSIILAAPAPVFGHFQEALAAFEAANDDIMITLDLTIHLADEAARALSDGRADIAYFYALGEPSSMTSRYAWSEQINVYAGVDHPLAHQESISPIDLAAIPSLALEPHNPLRRIIDEALSNEGIALGPPVLETDNMFDIMSILREGDGCFAAFGPLARDLGRMNGIQRLALERPLPAIEVRQALDTRGQGNSAAAALAEFLFL